MRPLALAVLLAVLGPAAATAQDRIGGVGPQIRLTQHGPDGDPRLDVSAPDIAYNERRDEYFVVWHGPDPEAPDHTEVFGRRLDGAGQPIGESVRISVPGADPHAYSASPAVAYDSRRDRYAVVMSTDDHENGLILDLTMQLVRPDGVPLGERVQVNGAATLVGSGFAWDPDIVFNPLDDRYVVAFIGTEPTSFPGWPALVIRAIDPETGRTLGNAPQPLTVATSERLQLREPAIVARPDGRYVVSWLEQRPDAPGFLGYVLFDLRGDVAVPVGSIGNIQSDTAGYPALAAHPSDRRVLLTFSADYVLPELPDEGREVYARVILDDGTLGPGGRISSAGPPGGAGRFAAEHPGVAYHSQRGAFLVAWTGTDDDRPGIAPWETEVAAQLVDIDGREVGTDDFLLSRMGSRGHEVGPEAASPAIATSSARAEWLVAWAGDDGRAPLAFGESELWARRVGPVTTVDDDQDGAAVDIDCDDTDPVRAPGATDVPFNGVDEDCSGADSHDFDRDGWEVPRDCDDTSKRVHPGAREVAGNGIDEDCRAGDRLLRTTARVRAAWLYSRRWTRAVQLQVEGASRGMTIRVTCSGDGCPKRLRRAQGIRAGRHSIVGLTHLLRGARLAPGANVTVRIADPHAIGVIERFRTRAGQGPRQVTRCFVPGRTSSTRCRS